MQKEGAEKIFGENNLAPYPQHINILGVIARYCLSSKNSEKKGGPRPMVARKVTQ